MIENISDFLNIAISFVFVFVGLFYLCDLSFKHRAENIKKREELYYRYYDSVSDDSTDEEAEGLYLEGGEENTL